MTPSPTIERVDITPVDIPLTDEFVISQGRMTVAENAFVAIHLDSGVVGYGEIAPFAALTGETREASVAAARKLADTVIGRKASDLTALSHELVAEIPEAPAARAGIECALFDAFAREQGKPLWELWGAKAVREYETDITLPILEEERIDDLAESWYVRGFRIFKLKVGADPDADVRRVRRLAARHSDVSFVLDANQGFDVAQTVAFLADLGDIADRIALLEQPIARGDLEGMAKLRQGSSVHLAADESVFTLDDARRVIGAGAADVINLKIMKSGLVETLAIAEMATRSGVGLMVGGMVETRLAMSFSLALALGVGGVTHFDLDTPLLMAEDPVRGGFAYDGPRMMMWNEPGIGAAPVGG